MCIHVNKKMMACTGGRVDGLFKLPLSDSLSVAENVSTQSQTFNNASVLFWDDGQSTRNLTQISSTQNKCETTKRCMTVISKAVCYWSGERVRECG